MTIPCRVKTPLEVASSGLRLNKTKKLSVVFFGGEKGRGVVSEENIPAGHFVCEYKYSKSYPMKEREEMVKQIIMGYFDIYFLHQVLLLLQIQSQWARVQKST